MNSGMRSMGETSHTTANQSQALFLRDTLWIPKQPLEEHEQIRDQRGQFACLCSATESEQEHHGQHPDGGHHDQRSKKTRMLGDYDRRGALLWTRAARLST